MNFPGESGWPLLETEYSVDGQLLSICVRYFSALIKQTYKIIIDLVLFAQLLYEQIIFDACDLSNYFPALKGFPICQDFD